MASRWYVQPSKWVLITQWAAVTTYSIGDHRRQLAAPSLGNERVFKLTGGTTHISGAAEPAWNLSDGATTNDGTCVWTQVAGRESEQLAGNWLYPLAYANAIAGAGDDKIFLSHDYSVTQASQPNYNWTEGAQVLCVRSDGATLPPTQVDMVSVPTAILATSGAHDIALQQGFVRGCIFQAGSAANQASIQTLSVKQTILDTCALVLNNTNSNSRITLINNTSEGVEWINTTTTWGAAGQSISGGKINLEWRDTPSGGVQGVSPTNLFTGNGGSTGDHGQLLVHGVDLQGATGVLIGSQSYGPRTRIWDCLLANGVNVFASTTFPPDNNMPFIVDNCDDATHSRNYMMARAYYNSQVYSDVTIIKTGGATDGVTPYSWKYLTATGTTRVTPAFGPTIMRRLNAIGSALTCTIELIALGRATAPTNADIWMELWSLDSASSPIAAFHTSAAGLLDTATTLTTSTAVWSSKLSNRQNNHTYSTGDIFTLASNPNRVFYVTNGALSNGSEPVAYATAVDGQVITDGSATVQANWRHSIAITFTPQMKGTLKSIIKSSLANINATSNGVFYVDPKRKVA